MAYSGVFTLVALVGAGALLLAVAGIEVSSIDDSLASAGRSLQLAIAAGDGYTLPRLATSQEVAAYLFDRSGNVLDASGPGIGPRALAPTARRVPSDGTALLETQNINGTPQRVRASVLRLAGGDTRVLVLSRSQAEAAQLLATTASVVLLGLLGLVVVATVLGYGLAQSALRPVREIAAAARTFSEQDLHRRIELDLPSDELGELAATFNSMLARLETAFDSLSRFTADAAHELRAPLTLIRTEAEVALSRERSPEDYRSSLRTVLGEAERLSRLADQLLMLARAEAGALTADMRTFDFVEVLHAAIRIWRPAAAERHVEVRGEAPDAAAIWGDSDLLRRLLDNLVDNALRHSPAGGTVTVILQRDDWHWQLSVADVGSGVPESSRASIFDRFTRADGSRTRDTGGAGLGLALCTAIAELHHGSIRLDEGHHPGARFIVRLAVARS